MGKIKEGWYVGYIVEKVIEGDIMKVYGWRYMLFVEIVNVIIDILMKKGVKEKERWVREKEERERGGRKLKKEKRERELKEILGNKRVRKMLILWEMKEGLMKFGY